MHPKPTLALGALSFVLASAPVHGEAPSECSPKLKAQLRPVHAKLRKLSASKPAPRHWPKFLHDTFGTYEPCLDGDFGEDFSTAVTRLLSNDPTRWGQLFGLMDKDPAFRDAVMSRVGRGEVEQDDLQRIRGTAERRCPKGHEALCKDIAARLEAAEAP